MQITSSAHHAVTYARGVSDCPRYLPEDTPGPGTTVSAPTGADGSAISPLRVGTVASVAPVTPRVPTGPLANATDGAGVWSISGADAPRDPYPLAEGGYDAGSEAPAVARSEAEPPTGFATGCGIICRQRPAVDDRLPPEPGSAP